MYIVCWMSQKARAGLKFNDYPATSDHYEVHEHYEGALHHYNQLCMMNAIYSANITKVVRSTDYTVPNEGH